ncbi:MAG: AI-2E family transporter [Synergistaceae bacterium]|nr:AI-2E family transporter [Synergistaceae bacterium]
MVIAWFMLQIFHPVIDFGKKIKLPPLVNLILVFSVLFSLFYIGIVFCTSQVVEFSKAYDEYHSKLSEMMVNLLTAFQIDPDSVPSIDWVDIVGRNLRNISGVFFAIFGNFVLTLVFFLFMFLESPYLNNKIDVAFSDHNAARIKNIMSSVSYEISRYLGTLTLISLATGVSAWIVLEIMGVKLAAGWGVLTFLLNYIPTVGSIIATIPPVMMAILQFSPGYIKPIIVLISLGAIQIFLGNFVTPKMVGDRLGLSPVIILISLLLWGLIWGIPGAILSVPIAVIIKIICKNFESLKPIAVIMGSGIIYPAQEEGEPQKKEKRVFPYQYAYTLLFPLRNIFLSPKQVIDRLELKDDMNVLEIGPGPGYFSVKAASALTEGRLVIADIQPEMLRLAEKRLKKRGIVNVESYLCDGKSFNFKDESFDRIFMVAVLGEVENKTAYMKEFYRLLKSGGILSISELAGDPDKMNAQSITELGENSGLNFYKKYGSSWNYTVNFTKD